MDNILQITECTFRLLLLLTPKDCLPLRPRVLQLIVDHLLQIDVLIILEDSDDEDLFFPVEMDQDTRPDMATKLDRMMDLMFSYIDRWTAKGPEEQELLWKILLDIFEMKLINTHKSKYVQFLLFYVCKVNPIFPQQFIDFVFARMNDPRLPIHTRQTCAGYLGSFLSRGAFLSLDLITGTLQRLVDWALKYVGEFDVTPSAQQLMRQTQLSNVNPNNKMTVPMDVESHGLFYSLCQSTFYIVCFHSQTLLGTKELIEFFKRLNILRIITSPLNPLKFCLPHVSAEFARLCSSHGNNVPNQLIERNKNIVVPTKTANGGLNQLETFFPFDPYLLRTSSKYVKDLYNEWKGPQPDDYEDFSAPQSDPACSPCSSLSNSMGMSFTPVELGVHFKNSLELH